MINTKAFTLFFFHYIDIPSALFKNFHQFSFFQLQSYLRTSKEKKKEPQNSIKYQFKNTNTLHVGGELHDGKSNGIFPNFNRQETITFVLTLRTVGMMGKRKAN